MTRRERLSIVVACLGITISGCARSNESPPPAPPPPLSLTELKNATYRGLESQDTLTLAGGRWEGPPTTAGGASRPSVTFVRDFHLMGDLDGDGFDEAVVLLGESSGGSGEFIHLAIVARRGMTAENVATAMIGDRIQVRAARLDSNRVILDVVQSGSQDAACCPGELAERTWTYADGALEPAAPVPTGRLSVTMLAGAEWVLRWWDWDQPAPDSIEVTLNFLGGRIAGKAACNRYTASIEDGEMPGDVTVGHAASTRMACPEPLMNAETRFLRNLAQAKKVGFMATMLSVGYESEGGYKVMLFEGRAPSAAAAP